VTKRSWWLLSMLLVSACDEPAPVETDAGVAPPADAGRPDAGPEPPLEPDLVCPGGPACPDEGDDVLRVGASAQPITPSFDDVDALTVDVDGDGRFDPTDGDEFEDRDGDGRYDAIWLAGFGNGRAATEIHDDVWARAVVLRQNETTLAFVAIDAVGLFLDDIQPIRDAVADLDVDYVSVSATHDHETYDTIGIWGPDLDTTGRAPEYLAYVQAQAAQAIRDAVAALEPANVQYASLRLRETPIGLRRLVSDTRDPNIIDDEVRVMRFARPADGSTISTLVNLSSHPEYMGSRNTALSSDYPNWLRDGIENGVEGPDGAMAEGVGGVCVFINGAVGSQIGPGRVQPQTWAGEDVERSTIESAATVGSQLAWYVLQSLGPDGGSTTDETADLAVRRAQFFLRIENRRYHIAYLQGLFVREVYNYEPDFPIRPGSNEPDVLTEIAVIDVGRAQLITVPGELDPALFVGGYDGGYTPEGEAIVDTSATNAPDLSMAPDGPYLRDYARDDAEHVWLLGLTNDFLGYFIPEFDYELDPGLPYIAEAPGDHYEETNSIGLGGWPRVRDKLQELLEWSP